jgi:hypothetical protein
MRSTMVGGARRSGGAESGQRGRRAHGPRVGHFSQLGRRGETRWFDKRVWVECDLGCLRK